VIVLRILAVWLVAGLVAGVALGNFIRAGNGGKR
jgi:hypothetical protein